MVNLSILPHHDIEEHRKTLLSIAASKGPNYRFGPLGAESQKKITTKERHQETAMQRSFVSFFWYFACIASERGIRRSGFHFFFKGLGLPLFPLLVK